MKIRTTTVVWCMMSLMMLCVATGPVAAQEEQVIRALQDRIEAVAEDVGRSVVSITTRSRAGRQVGPFDEDLLERLPPEFRDLLPKRTPEGQGEPGDSPLVPRGLGAGVIISAEGHILTNQHVIQDSEEIEVTLADGRSFPGKLVGADPRSDLAVIKIEQNDLPVATLSPRETIKRGVFVLALGSPFGFGADGQASVSFGIISGTGRRLPLGMSDDRFYGRLIQTDAAINPGNSGGPLCNLDGRVIGINVAIVSRSGGNMGLAFAIPINEATMDIINTLRRGEEVEYGFIGVSIKDPSPEESRTAGAPPATGAFVQDVTKGGPGDEAGLMPADLIIRVGDKRITSADQLVSVVGRIRPGSKVEIEFFRNGQKRTTEIEVGRRDIASLNGRPGGQQREPEQAAFTWRGIGVSDISAATRQRLGLEDTVTGVVVQKVEEGSPGARAALRKDMVINQVAGRRVSGVDEFREAAEAAGDRNVFVNVVGHGPTIVRGQNADQD